MRYLVLLILLQNCSDQKFSGQTRANPAPVAQVTEDPDQSVDGQGVTEDEDSPIDEEPGVTETCDIPKGQQQTEYSAQLEDYPYNLIDRQKGAVPGDYDDFSIRLEGPLVVETDSIVKIGLHETGTLNFFYGRDLKKTDCNHSFEFIFRKCPNVNSDPLQSETFNVGTSTSNSKTLTIPERNVFLEIILTTSSNPSGKYCNSSFKPGVFSIFDPSLSPISVK